MVDFENETVINTPVKSIESVLLFQKREAFLEAKEQYKKLLYQGMEGESRHLAVMRSRLLNLIDQWHGFLKRVKSEDLENWIKDLDNNDIDADSVIKIFYEISELMDQHKLTRIDVEKEDTTDLEWENEARGLD